LSEGRQKKKLDMRNGSPVSPDPMPDDIEELVDLMDHASAIAGHGQGVTAPTFDHAMRVFNQLKVHCDRRLTIQLVEAHHGLKQATTALKVATWWLAIITILLGAMELWKELH